jgi:hypothetical protein
LRTATIRVRLAAMVAALVAIPVVLVSVEAAPPAISTESVLILEVSVLDVDLETTTKLGSRTLEIRDGTPGELGLTLPWPSPEAPARLALSAKGLVDPEGERHRISIESSLETSEGERFRSGREIEIREGGTHLFDVVEQDGRRLVLALRAESETRPVLVGPGRAGAAVVFRLAVERVEGERSTPLETNLLRTFVGSGVEYSFHRGEGEAAESVRLLLRPVKLRGALAEIEVEVTGSLPGPPRRLALSRRELLFATRRSTSRLEVTTGEPPTGYRFLITPDF